MKTSSEIKREIHAQKREILQVLTTAEPKELQELVNQLFCLEIAYNEARIRELKARGTLFFDRMVV